MRSPQANPEGRNKGIQDEGSGNEELWSVAAWCDSRSPSPTLSNNFPQPRTCEDDTDLPSNVSGMEHVGSHLTGVAMPRDWQDMLIDIDSRKRPELDRLECTLMKIVSPLFEVPVFRPPLPQSVISSLHDTLQSRHRHVDEAISKTESLSLSTAIVPSGVSTNASSSHQKSSWDPRQSYLSTESLHDPEKHAGNDGLQHQAKQGKTRIQQHALRLVLVCLPIFLLIALCWQRNSLRS